MFTRALISQRSLLLLLFVLEAVAYIDVFVKNYWLNRCARDFAVCPTCFDNVTSIGFIVDDATYRNYVEKVDFLAINIDTFLTAWLGQRNVQPAFSMTLDSQSRAVIFKHKFSNVKLDHFQQAFCEYSGKYSGKHDRPCHDLWLDYTQSPNADDTFLTNALQHILLGRQQTNDGISLCLNANGIERFNETFNHFASDLQFWLQFAVNGELVLFHTFRRYRSISAFVPQMEGICGFVMVEQYAGIELDRFYDRPFSERVYVARQMLDAALSFSYGVNGFR